jgi:hypothetical protein
MPGKAWILGGIVMDRIKQKNQKHGLTRVAHLGSAAIILLVLAGCGTKAKVVTAVGAIGGTTSSVVTAVGGTVVSAAEAARTLATGNSGSPDGSAGSGSSGGSLPPEIIAGTAAATASANSGDRTDISNEAIGVQVRKKIIAGILFCTNIDTTEYHIDCFADQLDQVAETVPDDEDFGQARSIIASAAAQLSGIAKTRSSRELRPVTLSSSNVAGTGSTRPVVAIKSEDLPTAHAEAQLVLQETETLLLRSAETSERRRLPYTEIADAIGSSKVLLRSI